MNLVRPAIIMAVLLLGATSAQSRNYTVLNRFSRSGSSKPIAGLSIDAAGNLYGTTSMPGSVYKIDPAGKLTTLHLFTGGADGGYPFAGVALDSNANIHGTTSVGGGPGCGGPAGCGTLYRIEPSGGFTVLHRFTGGTDGGNPYAGVILDRAGNLYGTTESGGTGCGDGGCGVVYKFDTAGNLSTLYEFTGGADGAIPYGDLVRDSAGNLYGTALGGGNTCSNGPGCGTVFKLSPSGNFTILHSFSGFDGQTPYAGVVRDPAGNLYGTTYLGGGNGCGGPGCGVAFKIDSAGNFNILHAFTGGSDGGGPCAALIRDSTGRLYGTTVNGGLAGVYEGVVFELNEAGSFRVLHSFNGNRGGGQPYGALLRSDGYLYGTTSNPSAVFKLR